LKKGTKNQKISNHVSLDMLRAWKGEEGKRKVRASGGKGPLLDHPNRKTYSALEIAPRPREKKKKGREGREYALWCLVKFTRKGGGGERMEGRKKTPHARPLRPLEKGKNVPSEKSIKKTRIMGSKSRSSFYPTARGEKKTRRGPGRHQVILASRKKNSQPLRAGERKSSISLPGKEKRWASLVLKKHQLSIRQFQKGGGKNRAVGFAKKGEERKTSLSLAIRGQRRGVRWFPGDSSPDLQGGLPPPRPRRKEKKEEKSHSRNSVHYPSIFEQEENEDTFCSRKGRPSIFYSRKKARTRGLGGKKREEKIFSFHNPTRRERKGAAEKGNVLCSMGKRAFYMTSRRGIDSLL